VTSNWPLLSAEIYVFKSAADDFAFPNISSSSILSIIRFLNEFQSLSASAVFNLRSISKFNWEILFSIFWSSISKLSVSNSGIRLTVI